MNDLPERYFQELDQIQANISDNQIDLAVPRAVELYQDYPTLDANKLVVHALLLSGDDEPAVNYLDDFVSEYERNCPLATDVITTLIDHHAFVLCWQVNLKLNLDFGSQIETAEKQYQTEYAHQVGSQVRQVSACGELNIGEQSAILKQAKYLPLDSYKIATKMVLQDLDVWQAAKSDVLLSLKLAGVTDEVTATGLFQEGKTVKLAKMANEIEGKLFKRVKEILWKKIGAIDPVRWQMVEQEIFLQSAYLYPYEEQIVTNADDWAAILLRRISGEDAAPQTEEEQQLLEIQERLNQKIHADLGF